MKTVTFILLAIALAIGAASQADAWPKKGSPHAGGWGVTRPASGKSATPSVPKGTSTPSAKSTGTPASTGAGSSSGSAPSGADAFMDAVTAVGNGDTGQSDGWDCIRDGNHVCGSRSDAQRDLDAMRAGDPTCHLLNVVGLGYAIGCAMDAAAALPVQAVPHYVG